MAETPADTGKTATHIRDRILQAAVELFHRHGFNATSVREITAAVDLTSGALYNHFPSKEAVLYAVIERSHRELLSELQTVDEGAPTPVDAIRRFVRAYVTYYASYPREARVSNRDMEFLPESEFAEIAEYRRQTRRLLQDLLEQGVDEGRFSLLPAAGMPPQRAAAMAIMDMCVMVTEPYWLGAGLSSNEIADIHAGMALRLIGAESP